MSHWRRSRRKWCDADRDPSAPTGIGLGVDDLSTIPACLPEIKYLIRNMTIKEVQTLASKALKQTQPKAVFNLLQKFYLEHVGNVLQAQDGQE